MTPVATAARALRGVRERPRTRWLGALAPAVALAWVAGRHGAAGTASASPVFAVAAGLAVVAAGLASAPLAAALVHVWLVALLPAGTSLAELAAVEAGVLALLAAPDGGDGLRTALATVAAAASLAGVSWLVLVHSGSVAVAGAALLAVGAVAAGALDRTAGPHRTDDGGQP